MDQKRIILYLRMNEISLYAVHDDLLRTLGAEVVVSSTVTKYPRSAQFALKKEATPPNPADVGHRFIDYAILTALAECPFSSVREPSPRICLSRSTVRRNLTQLLRFLIRHL
jgi:hypothetical protein